MPLLLLLLLICFLSISHPRSLEKSTPKHHRKQNFLTYTSYYHITHNTSIPSPTFSQFSIPLPLQLTHYATSNIELTPVSHLPPLTPISPATIDIFSNPCMLLLMHKSNSRPSRLHTIALRGTLTLSPFHNFIHIVKYIHIFSGSPLHSSFQLIHSETFLSNGIPLHTKKNYSKFKFK